MPVLDLLLAGSGLREGRMLGEPSGSQACRLWNQKDLDSNPDCHTAAVSSAAPLMSLSVGSLSCGVFICEIRMMKASAYRVVVRLREMMPVGPGAGCGELTLSVLAVGLRGLGPAAG